MLLLLLLLILCLLICCCDVSKVHCCCRDKDGELQKQKEQAREQAALAEKALEEFKQQVEKNQNQIYADMKHQVRRAVHSPWLGPENLVSSGWRSKSRTDMKHQVWHAVHSPW